MILSKERGFDPLAIKGSWAGAFGLCQFVPSAYLNYAVDGNGDERVDLFNVVDALASVANYLQCNGWENGSLEKKRKAIYAYNHCDNYVRAVLAYAKATRITDAALGTKMRSMKRGIPRSVQTRTRI